MHEVIVRGSFFAAQYALPWLKKSTSPRIIHLAPPIDLKPKWFAGHTIYTLCKYSSAMLVIGLAEELAKDGIAVNAVWPRKLFATAAVQNLLGGDMAVQHSRYPKIVADAIALLVTKETSYSGKFHLDEDILRENNIDLAQYNCVAGSKLITDLYVEE